jgi:hypothetical protein
MGRLRNWQHEKFAQEIVAGTEPREAYVIAGYERNRANHNKLLRRLEVAARIDELKQAREVAARAARVPIDEVLAQLSGCGIDLVADFFDRDAAGILRVCDLQRVPVEVSIALLRFLREGLGIKDGSP